MPYPQFILDAPALDDGLSVFWDAFWDLMTCRDGLGGLVPWTAIELYCDRLEADKSLRRLMHRYFRGMETFHRDFMKKAKPKNDKPPDVRPQNAGLGKPD